MVVQSERAAADRPARTDVVFDPVSAGFVRVTIDAAGRVLARADLDPSEKRAVLRRLFATRSPSNQREAFVRSIHRAGLLFVLSPSGVETEAANDRMSDVLSGARDRREVEAFAECLETSIVRLLTLIWAMNFAVAPVGQPLPRLEAVDADLPYVPPTGVACPAGEFDAESVLQEVENAPEESIGYALH